MEIFSVCLFAIIYILASTFIILKLLQMVQKLVNIEDSSLQEFFIPNKSKTGIAPETVINPNHPTDPGDGSVPLEQFIPNPKRPVTVKYDQDEEGNTLTEVEDGA